MVQSAGIVGRLGDLTRVRRGGNRAELVTAALAAGEGRN